MSNFIRLIKKVENNNLSIPTKRVAAYLRGLAYNSLTWRLSCGKTETELKTGLTVAEVELLKVMIGHSSNSTTGLETGVLLTRDGTVAVGHVITGIDCGGFNRDTQVTIAGIIGLTSISIIYSKRQSLGISARQLSYTTRTRSCFLCLVRPEVGTAPRVREFTV